ncbi:MAG: HEAT repeat domain-containing protein [Dehalococcoidia bacterium]|nr:HEAT repeat domain-containing protein [Dehalococcoidia bacterium]
MSDSQIYPPLVRSETELPFHGLDPDDFERLWEDIVLAEGFTDVHRYAGPGQEEEGVDFLGVSPEGSPVAFQVKRVEKLLPSALREAVRKFAEGSLAPQQERFVIAVAFEANDRKLQDELLKLKQQQPFDIEIWDSVRLTHLLRSRENIVQTYFGVDWVNRFFRDAGSPRQRLDAEALLLGPVEALNLTSRVEEAQRLEETSSENAAMLYEEVADALRDRFPSHADRFQQRGASALETARDFAGSHDVLMALAIRDLFERAEPRVSPPTSTGLDKLHRHVDEVRQAHGAAVILFGRCHESPEALESLAECFDALDPETPYAPHVAVLLVEAALANRALDMVLGRSDRLRTAGDRGGQSTALRVRAGMGDAGVPGVWEELSKEAEELRLPAAEGAYVSLRAGRWCARSGDLDRAESFYRLAMKLGAEADLDLDVENALWSLTTLYLLPTRWEELSETNELALSINGTRAYVAANSRTPRRSFETLASGQLPDAHLWAKFRLLEAIRSGCLMDELSSHEVLARLYEKSADTLLALEHAVHSGNVKLVKESAPKVDTWPTFLAGAFASANPWVHRAALVALEHLGDMAPPDVARSLVPQILELLTLHEDDVLVTPELFKALAAVVLEASDDDLETLLPILERAAPREHDQYRLTDGGVMLLAARVYRFRSSLRARAAAIFGEMAVGAHTGEWSNALDACGMETGELIESIERVSQREDLDLAGTLAELGHLNDATREVWSGRLRFVANHPLGPRTSFGIGARYDVSPEFVREVEASAACEYVEKLVAIGSNAAEVAVNRALAFGAAAQVVQFLPTERRKDIFRGVKDLTDRKIRISETDIDNMDSQHALSRFQIRMGTTSDILAAAGWLLGLAAEEPDDCRVVANLALTWVRSPDPVLQQRGAVLLTLPAIRPDTQSFLELAVHSSPQVRRASPRVVDLQNPIQAALLEQLASDPDLGVRLEVVWAVGEAASVNPVVDRIRTRLESDESALVRAVAAEAFHS